MGEKEDLINRIKNFKEKLSEEKIVDMKFEDRLSDAYNIRISEGYSELTKEYSIMVMFFAEFLEGFGKGGNKGII